MLVTLWYEVLVKFIWRNWSQGIRMKTIFCSCQGSMYQISLFFCNCHEKKTEIGARSLRKNSSWKQIKTHQGWLHVNELVNKPRLCSNILCISWHCERCAVKSLHQMPADMDFSETNTLETAFMKGEFKFMVPNQSIQTEISDWFVNNSNKLHSFSILTRYHTLYHQKLSF